jgi:hypothetical protein
MAKTGTTAREMWKVMGLVSDLQEHSRFPYSSPEVFAVSGTVAN